MLLLLDGDAYVTVAIDPHIYVYRLAADMAIFSVALAASRVVNK
ncbi:hypothetical protein R50076_03410 [Gilvimarinus japonicus]